MNSTQQRLAVVDRMYSGDLSHTYLGSLSLLDPEVPQSFLQVNLHTFRAFLPANKSAMREFAACMHLRCAFMLATNGVGCDVHHMGLATCAKHCSGVAASMPAGCLTSADAQCVTVDALRRCDYGVVASAEPPAIHARGTTVDL